MGDRDLVNRSCGKRRHRHRVGQDVQVLKTKFEKKTFAWARTCMCVRVRVCLRVCVRACRCVCHVLCVCARAHARVCVRASRYAYIGNRLLAKRTSM